MRIRFITVAFASLFSLMAHAQVNVTDPWVRATTPQQKATGAFMKLESNKPMKLVGARSPVANVVEVHEMATVEGIMKMRPVAAVPLTPGQALELKPGSYHIMLMDLKAPVSTGQKVSVTLMLENEQKVVQEQVVEAEVRPLNAAAAMPAHGQAQH